MIRKLGSIFFFILLAVFAARFAIRYGLGEAREEAIDFPSYYYGAKLAFEMDTSPYSNTAWNIVKEIYHEGLLYPFLYPPPSLPFFQLFAMLEYETAKLVMMGLNHALAMVFVLLFFFIILDLKPYNLLPMAGVVYFYSFFPLVLTIYTGQVNLIILVSICLTWIGIKKQWKPIWIAIPLAFGIILKLYPILFFIILFLRRQYKAIIYTILILLVVSILVTPFLPHGIWQDWITNVASKGYLDEVRGVIPGRPGNQSINAFVVRLFMGLNVRFDPLISPPGWVVQVSPYLLSGIIGLLSLAATLLTMKDTQDGLALQFSIWLLAMIMIAPISWDHHLVFVLPAIYIAFLEAFKRKWYGWIPPLTGIACFLALNFDFNNPAYREGWRILLISSKLYAAALLWIFFIMLSLFRVKDVKSAATAYKINEAKWTRS